MLLVCPKCAQTECLWVEAMFTGWKGVEVHVDEDGTARIVPRRDDEITDRWSPDLDPSVAGCGACGWDGAVRELAPPEGQQLPTANQLGLLR